MRLGVSDVGSTTVHLLIVDARPGAHPLPASSFKHQLRLAEFLTPEGDIDDAGAETLAAFATAAPHRRKQRIPPGPAAQAAADHLREKATATAPDPGRVVIDLAAYDRAARGRNTLR